MSKTILITDASSGIGRETTKYFQGKGWNVAATLRSPKKEGLTDYNEYMKKIHAVNDKFVSKGNKPIKTAKVIYQAATSTNWKQYYPSGGDAKVFLNLRKLIPLSWFNSVIRRVYK